MKALSLVLSIFALSANAYAIPTLTVTCMPIKAIEPMRVSWDELRSVDSLKFTGVMGTLPRVEVGTHVRYDRESKDTAVSDSYTIDEKNEKVLLRDVAASNGLAVDSATFSITNIDSPPSDSVIPPGDYPATATLVLVASHRPGPGLPEIVETRSIDFNCRYVTHF